MKVVSSNEKGTLVEFGNLVRTTDIVGVFAPVRALIPTKELTEFQETSRLAGHAGREAARRLKGMTIN